MSAVQGRVPLDAVVADVINDLNLQTVSTDLDRFYGWAFWANIKIGSMDGALMRKACKLIVENYEAGLPKDFYQIIDVGTSDGMVGFTGTDYRFFGRDSAYHPHHCHSNCGCVLNVGPRSHAHFTVNSNCINISFKTGTILLQYLALPTDEQGKLTIKNSHVKAVSTYLQYRYIRSKYLGGELDRGRYMDVKQEWYDECAQAYVQDELPSPSEMEYIGLIWNNLHAGAQNNYWW